jgi:hypothetical protein
MKHADRLPLRRIAVHVDEPRPGKFEWVLNEASPPSSEMWTLLQKSARPVASYQKAMAQGLLALQALVEDLKTGPRASEIDLESANDEPPADRRGRKAADLPASQRRRTAFGFGLIG